MDMILLEEQVKFISTTEMFCFPGHSSEQAVLVIILNDKTSLYM